MNFIRYIALVTLSGTGPALFAAESIEFRCSDSTGAHITVTAHSALEFPKSSRFGDYFGPKTGFNSFTEIPMGCEIDNSDSNHELDPTFSDPKIVCHNLNTVVRIYRNSSGGPLIATVTEVDWPVQPHFVTKMECDR